MFARLALTATLALFAAETAFSDEMLLTPTKVASIQEEGGSNRVAISFDLTTLFSSGGVVIDEAILEWTLSGVSDEETSSFAAFAVTESWQANNGVAEPMAVSDVMASEWLITPNDYQRSGGLVKLNVTELARGWGQQVANNGFVMSTTDVSRMELASQVSGARLCIRYSFLKK